MIREDKLNKSIQILAFGEKTNLEKTNSISIFFFCNSEFKKLKTATFFFQVGLCQFKHGSRF